MRVYRQHAHHEERDSTGGSQRQRSTSVTAAVARPTHEHSSHPRLHTHTHTHSRGHIGATWRVRLNLCFLQPTRVHNPNGKSIGSLVQPFLHSSKAECRRAHWRHLANTIELVLPSAHSSPQPKRQIDRFSRFFHSSRHSVIR